MSEAAQPCPQIDCFALGPYETNCYVIHVPPDPACWIIDAGFDPEPLIAHVRDRNFEPEALILTHAHVDHIAGLDQVHRAFPTRGDGQPLPVLIHELEAAWLSDPNLNLSAFHGQAVTTRPADELLQGGETLELAGTRWQVLATPGHSPGGITLYHQPSGSAIVGDTLFAGSIGRFDFPTSSEQDLFRTIREVLYALPDDTTAYPGHGPTTTIGREKKTNPFVQPTPAPHA